MWEKAIAILVLCGLVLSATISAFAVNAEIQIKPDDNPALIYVGIDLAVIPMDQIPRNHEEWDKLNYVKRILTRQKKIQVSIKETLPKGNYILAERILYTSVGEEGENEIIIGNADNETKGWNIIKGSEFKIGKKQENNPTQPSGGGTGTVHLLKVGYTLKNPSGYIYGYPNRTFRPDDPVTRAEFIAMLDRLVKKDQSEINMGIKDIEGHWACTNIKNWEAECVDITKDSQFRPDQPITRQEIADVCSKIFNFPQHSAADFFSDTQNSPFRKEINDLGYAGIIKGYQGQFRPKDTLTRAELVTLFNQNFFPEERKAQINIFSDIYEGNWYYDNVLRAIGEGEVNTK